MITLARSQTSSRRRPGPTTRVHMDAASRASRSRKLAWVPACAGMTDWVGKSWRLKTRASLRRTGVDGRLRGHDGRGQVMAETRKFFSVNAER
jgi:hypothetical protein